MCDAPEQNQLESYPSKQVKPEMKLPVLYLVDSIVKNIGRDYTSLFTQNIVSTFCGVFEKVFSIHRSCVHTNEKE